MLSQSVTFGLLSASLYGVTDFGIALTSRRVGNLALLLVTNASSVLAATVYLMLADSLSELGVTDWLAVLGVAVLTLASYPFYFAAMRHGPIAVVSPIASAHSAVPIILAVILLGERMNTGQSIGVIAAVIGVVLASVDLRSLRNGTPLFGRGAVLAVVAMASFGLLLYFIALLSRDLGWFLPIYALRLLTLGLVTPAAVVRRSSVRPAMSLGITVGLLVIGLTETGGLFAFARGAEVGSISIVSAVSSSYPVVAIAGGLVVFRERPGPNQALGVMTVIVGLVLLGLSS